MIERGAATGMEPEQTAARSTRDAEFEQYMAARQPSLLRTAYLLTGAILVSGFVSLTLGRRQSIGQPIPGEVDASQVMLSAGVRWR